MYLSAFKHISFSFLKLLGQALLALFDSKDTKSEHLQPAQLRTAGH